MKNSAYWVKRFEILEKAALNKGISYFETLEEQYRIASANIEKDLLNWYSRFAKNNDITFIEAKKLLNSKELSEFKWSINEYIKYGQENALNERWMKQLENYSIKTHISRLEALNLQLQHQVEVLYGNQVDGIDFLSRDIYSSGYYHTAYEIQKGFNIGWTFQALNEKQLDIAISKPWTADNNTFRDRCWTNKQQLINSVQTQLTQAIIRGDAQDKAIRNIVKEFNVSKNKAGRLVMTESAFFASTAQMDCFNKLDVEKFEIVATLDNRTSEICQGLDGHVFNMKDYQVGLTAPPFHPWCRTTTIPHFDDNFGERAAKGADGKTYYVPSDMKYKEWHDKYVKGNPVEELAEKKHKKENRDKIQYNKYIDVLGKENLPKSIDKFQNLKYNNTNEYEELVKKFKSTSQLNWEKNIISEASQVDDYKVIEKANDIPQWMENQRINWSQAEKDAFTYYTSQNYTNINKYLRGKISATSDVIDKINNISNAINRSVIDENIVLWRGTSINNFTQADWLRNTPTENWIGMVIDDKAFSSTSILKASSFENREVFMQILVPKYLNGAYIKEVSQFSGEFEMLLQKGSEFKIISAEKRGGKNFIQVLLMK